MNTMELPSFLAGAADMQTLQGELFSATEAAQDSASGLFADVVFDRPLDHAYTYAVPERLRGAVAVGKRVQAPFGRGDKATPGFCVRLSETAPHKRDVSRKCCRLLR